MSEPPRDPLTPYALDAGTEPLIKLDLHRYVGDLKPDVPGDRQPVLLLHGASANRRTFMIPEVGLAPWLYNNGFDPWLLDWRGSSLIAEKADNQDSLRESARAYNFNRAAREDLPAAVAHIRAQLQRESQEAVKEQRILTERWQQVENGEHRIALLGHCMGGAVIAEAIAFEHLTRHQVSHVVLSALGLFYEAPLESRLKSEERVLERLLQAPAETRVQLIDPRSTDLNAEPRRGWPDELNDLYRNVWPTALREHATSDDECNELCDRLCFMYGMPYHHRNLPPSIHKGELLDQFGAIPLHMYLHGARNLRIGQATDYESRGLDSARPVSDEAREPDSARFVSDDARARFLELDSVTLITGEHNRLWHRGSIDRMYEWLCHGPSGGTNKCVKRIFPNYAHQDLFWGQDAPRDVYPFIDKRLRPTAVTKMS